MPHPIRFLFVLHDHQPVGNFDGVFEQAYQDSYRPFLELFESYSEFKFALHTSGSLIEWLDAHHPEYLDRLAALVAADRLEIVGGAFFEPILPMIPSRDRIGQIRSYREYLHSRLGAKIRGAWIPERVWEQSLTSDIAAAGAEYIILDDSHFKSAGLDESQLFGYYLTEDGGRLLRVFPAASACGTRFPLRRHTIRSTICAASPSDSPMRWLCSPTMAKSSAVGPKPRSRCSKKAGCGSFSIWCARIPSGFICRPPAKPSITCRRWEKSTFPKAAIEK